METFITRKVPIFYYKRAYSLLKCVCVHKPEKCVTLQLLLLQGYEAVMETFQVSMHQHLETAACPSGHIYMKMSIPSSTLTQWSKAII